MSAVSIIIPVYNALEYARQCLKAFTALRLTSNSK